LKRARFLLAGRTFAPLAMQRSESHNGDTLADSDEVFLQ
jgi:hypothetical protein